MNLVTNENSKVPQEFLLHEQLAKSFRSLIYLYPGFTLSTKY